MVFCTYPRRVIKKIILNRHQGILNKIEKYLEKFAPEPKLALLELKRIARESFIESYKNGLNSEGGYNRRACPDGTMNVTSRFLFGGFRGAL